MAAPWLPLGFMLAGLEGAIYRWLGGGGVRPIVLATLIGTPLPLCSCNVIPVGIGLCGGGTSKAATTAFLTSTPSTTITAIMLA